MLEILEGKGLSFLFPLLKLEKELLKQIKADPSPQSIYKWIKDNISPRLHTDKGFELCMAEGDDQLAAPSKEQLEQEKQLLLAFKPVMQKFLHDHTELQVSALYALQVHCNANGFPKGTPALGFLLFCKMSNKQKHIVTSLRYVYKYYMIFFIFVYKLFLFLKACCCATLSTFTTWRSLKKKPSLHGKKILPKNSLEKEKLYSRYTSVIKGTVCLV
ncbi:Eukaryotic translation initiation factor 4 gamma 2 [Goodea atripinnis]|uniref:Eukaryotic translation initiation factor 4 gamma 2 n=1 Tax=Goodea atripinnis TaxID=208336 RepID=A0ABV0N7F0_9TELE